MNESNHAILDMRELEIILKPFLKNGLIELDHNNSEYHNISKELFLFFKKSSLLDNASRAAAWLIELGFEVD